MLFSFKNNHELIVILSDNFLQIDVLISGPTPFKIWERIQIDFSISETSTNATGTIITTTTTTTTTMTSTTTTTNTATASITPSAFYYEVILSNEIFSNPHSFPLK